MFGEDSKSIGKYSQKGLNSLKNRELEQTSRSHKLVKKCLFTIWFLIIDFVTVFAKKALPSKILTNL